MSKRRFWQIHLSTAVVLMFVAGGLLWLNLPMRKQGSDNSDQGWPCVWRILNWCERCGKQHSSVYVERIPINVISGIAVAIATASICESLIRRRKQSRA